MERFLQFVNTSRKRDMTAEMIIETLKEHHIPFSDCRARGYDNAANMAEKYKDAKARILAFQCFIFSMWMPHP